MSTRDFKTAAKLFLEAVPTFSSYELFTYEELVFYSVITSMLGGCDFFLLTAHFSTALDRPELKNEVLKGSEIQEQLSGGGKDGTLTLAKVSFFILLKKNIQNISAICRIILRLQLCKVFYDTRRF
jgi:hypothetical protein